MKLKLRIEYESDERMLGSQTLLQEAVIDEMSLGEDLSDDVHDAICSFSAEAIEQSEMLTRNLLAGDRQQLDTPLADYHPSRSV